MINTPNLEEDTLTKDESLGVTVWKKRGGDLSVLELMDFDAYMRGKPEHRNGDFTTVRVRSEDPQEIIFFGENPDDEYLAHFKIMENLKHRTILVTCIKGNSEILEPYLLEYGFDKVPE